MSIKHIINRNFFYEGIVLMLNINFFYEGVQKLAYIEAYSFWVSHAPLIKHWAVVFQYAVPVTELTIAAFLLIPKYNVLAFWGIILTQTGYIVWVTYVFYLTPYIFWPYQALWEEPNWFEKLACSLCIGWIAYGGLLVKANADERYTKYIAQ